MKKLFYGSLVAYVILVLSTLAYAETLSIDFSYGGTGEYAATEYYLYMDGARVCDITEADAINAGYSMTCDNQIINEGQHSFHMTALRVNGTESPPSAVVPYFIDWKVNIIELRIEKADGTIITLTVPI